MPIHILAMRRHQKIGIG